MLLQPLDQLSQSRPIALIPKHALRFIKAAPPQLGVFGRQHDLAGTLEGEGVLGDREHARGPTGPGWETLRGNRSLGVQGIKLVGLIQAQLLANFAASGVRRLFAVFAAARNALPHIVVGASQQAELSGLPHTPEGQDEDLKRGTCRDEIMPSRQSPAPFARGSVQTNSLMHGSEGIGIVRSAAPGCGVALVQSRRVAERALDAEAKGLTDRAHVAARGTDLVEDAVLAQSIPTRLTRNSSTSTPSSRNARLWGKRLAPISSWW